MVPVQMKKEEGLEGQFLDYRKKKEIELKAKNVGIKTDFPKWHFLREM